VPHTQFIDLGTEQRVGVVLQSLQMEVEPLDTAGVDDE
jgi:hypothetical protein